MAELEQAKSQIIAHASDITQVSLHLRQIVSHFFALSRILPPQRENRLRDELNSCQSSALSCNLKRLTSHQASDNVTKELEQTQMKLSMASQELSSLKTTAQQAQREREQVTEYSHQMMVDWYSISKRRWPSLF